MIDEPMIFGRALTSCEIGALHDGRSGGFCTGDMDGDTLPDFQDNCPGISNPGQADLDADGTGDACDCAPSDSGLYSIDETDALTFTDDEDMEWCLDRPVTGPATTYDVIRGDLDELPVGSGSPTCRSLCRPPLPGLVGWWTGDGTGADLAGGHTGTLENGVAFDAGLTLGAFSFDGVNDRVRTGNVSLGSTFSVSAWVRSNVVNQGAYQRIVETSYATHFMLGTDNLGTRYKLIVDTAPSPYGAANGGTIVPGEWQHVTGTFDGVTGTLYVDGRAVASDTFAAPGTVSLPVNIGAYLGGGYGWDGLIDEVQIYDRALTAEEVFQVYEAGSAGFCKNALGGTDAEWTAPWSADDDIPPPGKGLWYLYRARNATCGVGTWGFRTDGPERISTVCD